jgi:serine/threonine-protein kinase
VGLNSETEIQPGTVLDGKYSIVRQVGAGGMGAVYEATHTTIGRRVAIKTLHLVYATDEQLVERFHREAQMAGSIGHDNICEVTDIGTAEDGSPYLVMPLLAGGPLADLVGDGQRLPIPRLIDIVAQTLSALQAAHEAKIVHRDLKPDNIFVTKIGDRKDFVKLLDFGISKLLDQDAVLQLTQTGTVLGTPFYMAPEQAKGAKEIDHRVDLYAIGVILYEAITGQRPFEGDTYNEIMYKIIAEPFPQPRQLNDQVPPQLEQIVLKAMAREPEERFQSAAEMRKALASAVAATPLHIQIPVADSMAPPPPSTTSAEGRPISATAMETVSTGVGTTAAPRSKRLPLIVGLVAVVLVLAGVVVFLAFGRDGSQPPVAPLPQPSAAPEPTEPVETADKAVEPQPEPALEAEAEAGVQADETKEEPAEATKEAAAEDTSEKKVAKKGGKKGKKGKKSSKSQDKSGTKSGKEVVKGRFGTTFVGDYDE